MRTLWLSAILAVAIQMSGEAQAQSAAISEIAPQGRLRVGMLGYNPGAFLSVHMAVALPKGRSSAAQAKFADLIGEAKRTGVVQKAIDESGLTDVRAAPN